MTMKPDEIYRRFQFHPPRPEDAGKLETLRHEVTMLANVMAAVMPDGRELGCAISKLEEAWHWACAGVVSDSNIVPFSPVAGESQPTTKER